MHILVVGAGFAGATAARELAEAGHKVHVVDKRPHIAGNAYDYVNEHGIRVHQYGPHLWHTSNDEVQAWASRFTEWVSYRHWVRAQLADGSTVPLPINPETIEAVFGNRFYKWAYHNDQIEYQPEIGDMLGYKAGAHAKFLETLVEHHDPVTNSRQHVENSVGKELCDLFFAPYTKKMWGLELEELPASVAARIPTNVESGSNLYFPKDKHQYLPKDGYTAMVRNILDHPNIAVALNAWRPSRWRELYDALFTSEPIDEYFGCDLGSLPWRSVRMHTYSVPVPKLLDAPVINFTHAGPHTRVTEWKQLPGHGDNPHWTTLTAEEPCDYKDNNLERYYPVKTSQAVCPNRELYKQYKARAKAEGVHFIGRCGQYAYLDMHQAISSTLAVVRRFVNGQEMED
jgi:UDP-galactopyranose mutase